MHRMTHNHFDDTGLIDIDCDLTIEFGFADEEPASHFDPGIPAHPFDVKIVAAVVHVGNADPVKVTHPTDLQVMNKMLDPSFWKNTPEILGKSQAFTAEVEAAICEHMANLRDAARESAAEAKFQAMRDGE